MECSGFRWGLEEQCLIDHGPGCPERGDHSVLTPCQVSAYKTSVFRRCMRKFECRSEIRQGRNTLSGFVKEIMAPCEVDPDQFARQLQLSSIDSPKFSGA